ncbi:PAS domain-containing protein [Desulfonatronum thioautotrophicum]|uniref:PAS domain-containing protein n=1 Tax=Desulfonatronum thioautotrophicum TaxID=617001 RepID=UPI0006995A8D|nr:PAS domain-containing protein [Desulfonatronum thioautotrophicum]
MPDERVLLASFSVTAFPLPNNHVGVAFENITERKRAELEIRRQSGLIRTLLDSIPDFIFIKDTLGTYLVCNTEFAQHVGRHQDDIPGKTDYDLYSKGEADFFREHDRRMLELEKPRRNEEWVSYPDGRKVLLDTLKTPYRDADGTVLGIIGICRDITERKQAEDQLIKSERLLANALSIAQLGHWELDLTSRTFAFTDNFYEIFRTNASEMGGYAMSLDEYANRFLHPEDRHHVTEETRKALETSEPGYCRYLEHRILYADGSSGHISVRFFIEKDEHGKTVRSYGVNQDITERKRVEEELLAAKEQAEVASVAKSEFLANMSHEIRTPLNGIMGTMQLLETTTLDSEQRQYAQMAMGAANRLTRLLSDILDLSRVEAGKMSIHAAEFAVQELADSVCDLFRVAAREKNTSLECSVDPDTPSRLIGDEARVRQILFNLVGNALKFTDKGDVRLTMGPLSSPRPDACRLHFSVSDTGIGIPDDKLEQLFKPFVQVDNSYTRSFQGAGLGLAIVKRLLDLLGGRMCVDSTVGEGTTVHVVLPFKRAVREGILSDQKSWRLTSSKTQLRILLAEDEPSNAFAIRVLLEKAGHHVTLAENGRQALDLFADRDFDVILMDVQMPMMNGVETTRRIRAMEVQISRDNDSAVQDVGATRGRPSDESPDATGTASSTDPAVNREPGTVNQRKHIPIIALTAYAMNGDREKFLEAGMDAYLAKPVRMEDLVHALEEVTCKR